MINKANSPAFNGWLRFLTNGSCMPCKTSQTQDTKVMELVNNKLDTDKLEINAFKPNEMLLGDNHTVSASFDHIDISKTKPQANSQTHWQIDKSDIEDPVIKDKFQALYDRIDGKYKQLRKEFSRILQTEVVETAVEVEKFISDLKQ